MRVVAWSSAAHLLLCCCPLVLMLTPAPDWHQRLPAGVGDQHDVFYPSQGPSVRRPRREAAERIPPPPSSSTSSSSSAPLSPISSSSLSSSAHYHHEPDPSAPLPATRHRRRQRRGAAAVAAVPPEEAEDDVTERTYDVTAPRLFGEAALRLQLLAAAELLSPGFVIQRVSGNSSWLEEVAQLQCYYSGYVQGELDSVVSLSLCGGMRGMIDMRGNKYFIEPLPNSSSSTSESALSLEHRPHIIYRQQPSKNHSTSNCSVKENFKHRRLKKGLRGVTDPGYHRTRGWRMADMVVRNSTALGGGGYDDEGGVEKGRDPGGGNTSAPNQRHRRSPGMSRKLLVETLVVADSYMFEYHGKDVHHYVLTLMSIVRNIYRDPSLRNYISIVVVKFIIFEQKEDMPFNMSYNAATTLRNFCEWQHHQNDPDGGSSQHYDTAILVTRKDICRAPGKCDTLGLAELGTICDSRRSCSIIEDNGLSSAFTIAHELGHVFNLPHDDDDTKCRGFQGTSKGGKQYHVMAPTLDANSHPWDWSACSAHIMTDFIDDGLAECLRDPADVDLWNQRIKAIERPGLLYAADRQCQYVFGPGYGLCPYMVSQISVNYPTCERLWCTNKTDSPNSGCRTQHMPWADGTSCGQNRHCQQGKCVPVPHEDNKPVNGGWGPWSKYNDCSRTCGGGVKQKERVCNSPPPSNSGHYCLGRRIQYKSCNTQPCPASSDDFRAEQCANFNSKVSMTGLPSNTKWIPATRGIHIKDVCKLYCRPLHSTAYYQLAKTVVDGTKCESFTDDICVNGQCWQAGCDNKLGSNMKRDHCGVCGGDNHSCRTVNGTFNNAIYGYNFVTNIPAGATQLDIRQHGGDQYNPDDDNYLAIASLQEERKFLLNGDFVVRTDQWQVKVKGGELEYSGSDHQVERINFTHMLGEPISVYVLSVGKLQPPNVTYSYIVSAGDNVRFKWTSMGAWRKCSHICRGKRRRKIVCVREDDSFLVSKKRCQGMKKPPRIEEACNTECILEWRVIGKEECPVRCGQGMRRQLVHCVKLTGFSQADILKDSLCRKFLGAKPDEFVPCSGKCLPTYWSYTKWSPCSVTCGGGRQERRARCVDEEGKELGDSECGKEERTIVAPCNDQPCPRWETGDWLGCSASCGVGRKQRKVWCLLEGQKVDDAQCNRKLRPISKKECNLRDCPEWYPGGWGPCSVTCGRGVSLRAVKCRVSASLLEDHQCDAGQRPEDRRLCSLGECLALTSTTTTTGVAASKTAVVSTTPAASSTSSSPTTSSQTTTLAQAPQAAYWRFGSWTECSTTCGQGSKHRFVVCRGYGGDTLDDSFCARLPRPPAHTTCVLKLCGDWRSSDWSDCTVTCGEGIRTRFVQCTFNEQTTDESFCDTVVKPNTEIRCNRGTCISPEEGDFKTGVITSNRVEGTSRYLTWDWSTCSVTCGTGWQHRHVVCYDERGPSDHCDKSMKPDSYQACDRGVCPIWQAEDWSECPAKACQEGGVQQRHVMCRTSNGTLLSSSSCDQRLRPTASRQCQGPCNSSSVSTSASSSDHHRWHAAEWSSCSVTCGRGHQQREITCLDRGNNSVAYDLCRTPKPRNTKRCSGGPCPRWRKGKWTKCSVTCGEGQKTREVACISQTREVVSPLLCSRETQPKHVRACKRKDCSLFVWNVGQWSECTMTCGFGRKHRPVTCTNHQGQEVSSHLCDDQTKPKTRRRCAEFPCPYLWNAGPWSPCSSTCGEGQQMRTVVCQAVTKEGWVLSGEVPDGCRAEDRPPFARYCNYGDCRAKFHWSVGQWGECTARCGNGRERRRVTCMDRDGQPVDNGLCLRLYRPPRHRPCYSGPCYARSCKELKELTTIRKDGDYKLQVGDQLLMIYCKDMRKSTPTEYLSLSAGEANNYAEVYSERLRRPATCPYNKTRPANCDLCRMKQYRQAGYTTFSKVRIDLNTLRIIVNDPAFSHVHSGMFIPFGTAGDCYSSDSCPQGQFSVNLVGTGFIVSINTTWTLLGNQASQQIWRRKDGEIIRGQCGGYCGLCSPDHLTGLQLQLFRR